MTVTLLRHGATRGNKVGRYTGRQTDEPISPETARTLAPLAARGAVPVVYTSGMRRCDQTAALLYPGARLVPVPGLAEMDFGAFEGKSWREMEGDKAYRAWVDGGCEGRCPGGESQGEFILRTTAAFMELLAACHRRGERDIHIVAHGGTCMAVGSALALPQRGYFSWGARPCGGYQFTVDEEAIVANTNADERPLRLLREIP